MYDIWCSWWILDKISDIITSNIFFSCLISPFTSLMTHMYTFYNCLTSLENFLFFSLFFLLSAFHTFKLTNLFCPLTFSNMLMGSSIAFLISMTVFYSKIATNKKKVIDIATCSKLVIKIAINLKKLTCTDIYCKDWSIFLHLSLWEPGEVPEVKFTKTFPPYTHWNREPSGILTQASLHSASGNLSISVHVLTHLWFL